MERLVNGDGPGDPSYGVSFSLLIVRMDPFLIAIALFLAGVLLAVIDIFVPSGGMLLILCTVCAVGSVLFGFRSSTTMGMTMLTLVVASVPIGVFLAIKIWPHTPIGRMVILKPPSSQSGTADGGELESWVGSVLRADSALMPAGQIKIGHRRLNAVAESGFIEAGQAVKVLGIRERSLLVRPTSEPLTPIETVPGKPTTAPAETEPEPVNLLDLPADQLGLDSIDEK